MRKGLIILGGAGVVLLAALLYLNQQAQGSGADQSHLRTVRVERGEVVVTVRATGRVEAEQVARLSFAAPGLVEAVPVAVGQAVQAGDVLARLDGEAQRIAVEQAEWALRIARLTLEALQSPPDERELAVAQANVNSAWTAYVDLRDNSVAPEDLRIAELRYQQALAAASDAGVTYNASNGGDLYEAQLGAAGFGVEVARLQLEMLRDGPTQAALDAALARVGQAQAQLEQLQAGPLQAQIDQAELAVQQAELRLEQAQAAYEDTVLRAPFGGVVTQVNVQAGGLAAPVAGLPAVEVTDLSQLHVLANIDEVDVAQVTEQQIAEITLDALPGETLSGVVERVSDVSAESGGVIVYQARLALDHTAVPIRVGMTAAVTIVVRRVEDVLVVPNLFVRLDRRSGQAFVDVLDEAGNLAERPIELGAQNESVSAVVSGLQEGEVIAIDLNAAGFSFFEDEGE